MPEPVGIDISVAEDVTTIAVTSEDAINVAITEDTTDISVSAVPATTTAASITYDSYASITAETVQGALEALAWSHTCYNGKVPPCGECPACGLRAKGFDEAGIKDPLIERTK